MILILLIGAHFLADFTLQPTILAENKTESAGYLLLHAGIYAAVTAIVGFLSVEWRAMLLPWGIIAVSHGLVDLLRVAADKKWPSGGARFRSFLLDQVIHLALIAAVYYGFGLGEHTTTLIDGATASDTVRGILVCAVIWVIIWDPASVFVRKLFNFTDNVSGGSGGSEPRAGRIIGKLERLIIVILVLANQIGAIGFVLTAKSVARFKQLEDKDFAEKYLVGTLTSASIAIITALILRQYI